MMMVHDKFDTSTSPSLIRRLHDERTREAAWLEFVARYGRLLFHWCHQWGLQPSDADDVAQETLLAILQVIQDFRFEPGCTFRGWMRSIAQRSWYRLVESRQRPGEADTVGLAALATVEARDDLIRRFESLASQDLFDRAVVLVQRRVGSTTWEAFARTCLEQRDCAEVAHELGMTLENVYVCRSRVKKLLRQALAELDHDA